jgi:hypothetical protein
MKRSTLLLLAAVALPMTARAQTQTATINVNAAVASSVAQTVVNNTINFGATGLTTGTTSVANTDATNAYIVDVTANEDVSFSIATPSLFSNPSGLTAGTTPTLALSCRETDGGAATNPSAVADCSATNALVTFATAASKRLWVGASLTVPAGAPAGNYVWHATVTYSFTKY